MLLAESGGCVPQPGACSAEAVVSSCEHSPGPAGRGVVANAPWRVWPMRAYAVKRTRHLVAQREADTLTPLEVKRRQALADSGVKEELAIWIQYNRVARCERSRARECMARRFVPKWKNVQDKQGRDARTIRMLRALRGSQDLDEGSMDTMCGGCSPCLAAHRVLRVRLPP